VTNRIAILLLTSVPASSLAGFFWKLARRGLAERKQRLSRLGIELRLADALETFRQEVFKLKHSPVLRPTALGRNAEFIPSINPSSLRYIRGRENED